MSPSLQVSPSFHDRLQRTADTQGFRMKVSHGRLQAGVAHRLLDGPWVLPGIQAMRGVGVAQMMRGDVQPHGTRGIPHATLDVGFMDTPAHCFPGARVAAGTGRGKKEGPLEGKLPVRKFLREQSRQSHRNAGQPILYMSVKGKITSSGKRLTTPYACQSQGENGLQCGNGMAPSDEGTYGTSDAYIYFWSVTGQYYQWNGSYLYSDKPFRTTIAPLVIDVLDGDAPAPSTVPGIHPPAPR